MKSIECMQGRSFVLRLEQGETIHEVIEKFALDNSIENARVSYVGGADTRSAVVVGPENGRAEMIVPMVTKLAGEHECMGVGTLFRNEENEPVLHMHATFGRGDKVIAGCIRLGVQVWYVGEVVIEELVAPGILRKKDGLTGFELLDIVEQG